MTGYGKALPLYGWEAWSLTLREEHTLWMFQNMMPREIFGLVAVEETGEWRTTDNEEANAVYSSPNFIVCLFVLDATAPSGPESPHSRGFSITPNGTVGRTPLDE
jgi:hypothetical protein